MAHELETKKDGKTSMFYVGEVPWHGLGQKLDNPPTSAEAIKAAGLDWTVSVHPMETWLTDKDGRDICLAAKGRMVVRNSDNKRLSEVGPSWSPLQNEEAFKWFDPFIQNGECSFETAGSLFEGERIWVLAKLNREPMRIIGDDTINKYLMLSNCHSDKRSARVALCPIRTVCWNTESANYRNKSTKFIGVRHTDKIKDNLNAIREIINTANADFEATAEQYRLLTTMQVDQITLKKYIKLVFKEEDEAEKETVSDDGKRKYAVREDDPRLIENKIIPLFEGGRGSRLPGVRGTMWGAFNAITEFLNWHTGRTADARLDSLWFGQNATVNKRALDVALDMLKKAA